MPAELRYLLRLAGLLASGVVLWGGTVSWGGTGALAVDASHEQAFRQAVRPFLTQYCLGCHNDKQRKGELSLERYQDSSMALKERVLWEKVLENVQDGIMPPDDKPQPKTEEVASLRAWIEAHLSLPDANGHRNPGRVTIRRLNRTEYNNTIRDLFGINFRPADDFPSDDVGYGFDNIGDVLSLSPLLLEKYLAAAESVAAKGLAKDLEEDGPQTSTFDGRKLKSTLKGSGRSVVSLNSTGEAYVEFDFPKDGEYRVRIKAFGEQAGDEPARMTLRIGKNDEKTFDVTAEGDKPGTYETTVEAKEGERRVAAAFINDFYDPKNKDENRRDRNLIIMSLTIQGPLDRDGQVDVGKQRRILLAEPGKGGPQEAARKIFSLLARRAYRRPVTMAEVNRLVGFVDLALKQGESFEKGVELAVQAMLLSPHFLFRVELDGARSGSSSIEAIDDHQLACRLSYFLWSSMPDDELYRHASEGTLRKGSMLEQQARRMLADAKSQALVENFAGQWLQLRNLQLATPDRRLFRSFGGDLRTAMQRETEMFFAYIKNEDRSVLDFIDSDYTFLNERLAQHYGIKNVKGDEFRIVPLVDYQRGGILTQASVLTITSNPTRTSPVKRGKWILEQILGTPPPPPPPNAGELGEDEQAVLSGSLRQRMEQHRANATCASCHSRMDPLGFGLENYDATGAWRTSDGKFPIDASGELPDGNSFKGPAELKKVLLGKKDQFARAFTEKMLTYALGRGIEYYDRHAVDEIAAALDKDEYKFSRLIVEIVASEPFQYRRGRDINPGGKP